MADLIVATLADGTLNELNQIDPNNFIEATIVPPGTMYSVRSAPHTTGNFNFWWPSIPQTADTYTTIDYYPSVDTSSHIVWRHDAGGGGNIGAIQLEILAGQWRIASLNTGQIYLGGTVNEAAWNHIELALKASNNAVILNVNGVALATNLAIPSGTWGGTGRVYGSLDGMTRYYANMYVSNSGFHIAQYPTPANPGAATIVKL